MKLRPAIAASMLLLAPVLMGQSVFRPESATSGGVSDAIAYDPAPRDARFFGHWCQLGSIRPCRDVPRRIGSGRFSITLGTQTVCTDVEDVRAEIHYAEAFGRGSFHGWGEGRGDGERFTFALLGHITRVSRARMSAHVGKLRDVAGSAALTADGLGMQLAALGEVMTLRKDACGNEPPVVDVVSQGGVALAWGGNHCFEGIVNQDEDGAFPASRMVLSSSQGQPFDDMLAPAVVSSDGKRLTRCTSALAPGAHVVTFTATDSGGLSASDTVTVEVTNRPPRLPIIVQPRTDDTIVATGDLIFEGKAFDLEDGMLDGASLEWGAKGETGGFVNLGAGRRLLTSFGEPGPVTLRLRATDGAGATSQVDRELVVLPFAGNTPPRVTIEVPKHLENPGRFGGTFPPGEVTFRGTVFDVEDSPGPIDLRWAADRIQPVGPSLPPVTGSTLAVFRLSAANGNRQIWRITFSATDRGGFVGKKVIEVIVVP